MVSETESPLSVFRLGPGGVTGRRIDGAKSICDLCRVFSQQANLQVLRERGAQLRSLFIAAGTPADAEKGAGHPLGCKDEFMYMKEHAICMDARAKT